MQTNDVFLWLNLVFWLLVSVFFFGSAARSLGYSQLSWTVVSVLCSNPIALLYFLASLPNRNLDKARKKEMHLLRKKLEQKGVSFQESTTSVPPPTIGDKTTRN